jgi:PDZ domain-containing protein
VARRALVGLLSLLVLAAVAIALVASTVLPKLAARYYLLLPGEAIPVAPAVHVPIDRRQQTGDLSYTVVYEQAADLPAALFAAVRPGVRVVPYEAVVPPSQTPEQSTELNKRLMGESQSVAAVVALRKLGYDARVGGRGARVVAVLPDKPAAGALRVGDVIVGVDGQSIGTVGDLQTAIRGHQPGDALEVAFRRDGAEQSARVGTVPASDDPHRPLIGLAVETDGFTAELPFPVTIDAGPVLGPSAGLMFALGIYDALTPGPLGRGVKIAGTGTVDPQGRVGPVDGVAQKVIGAEKAGAALFFAPADNAAEARRAASSIRVVPVATFDDALDTLLATGGSGAGA